MVIQKYIVKPSVFIADDGRIRMRFTAQVDDSGARPQPQVTVDIDVGCPVSVSPPDTMTVYVTPESPARLDFSCDGARLVGVIRLRLMPQGTWALWGDFVYDQPEEFHFDGTQALVVPVQE